MNSLFNPGDRDALARRLSELARRLPQWGRLIYKHLDRHLRQFGV